LATDRAVSRSRSGLATNHSSVDIPHTAKKASWSPIERSPSFPTAVARAPSDAFCAPKAAVVSRAEPIEKDGAENTEGATDCWGIDEIPEKRSRDGAAQKLSRQRFTARAEQAQTAKQATPPDYKPIFQNRPAQKKPQGPRPSEKPSNIRILALNGTSQDYKSDDNARFRSPFRPGELPMTARNMLWIDLPHDDGETKAGVGEHLVSVAEFFPLSCPDSTRRTLMDVFDVHLAYDEKSVGVYLEPRAAILRPMATLILDKEQPSPDWPYMSFLLSLWNRLGVKQFEMPKADERRAAVIEELWQIIGRNLAQQAFRELQPVLTGSRLVEPPAQTA